MYAIFVMFTITHYKIDSFRKTVEDVKQIEGFQTAQQVVKNKAKHIMNAYPHSCIQSQTFSDDRTEVTILSLCMTHHVIMTKMDL